MLVPWQGTTLAVLGPWQGTTLALLVTPQGTMLAVLVTPQGTMLAVLAHNPQVILAAKCEASSAYRGIGLVKLMGHHSGFIAVKAGNRGWRAVGWRQRQIGYLVHPAGQAPAVKHAVKQPCR